MTSTRPQSSATARVSSEERPPFEAVPARVAAEPFQRIRPTVHLRPWIVPEVWTQPRAGGYPVEHPFVRKYWTPILGPGATADLLRLATAARRGRPLPRPVHITLLGRHDLVCQTGIIVRVRTTIPTVPTHLVRLLPQFLRRELRAESPYRTEEMTNVYVDRPSAV